jgi:hypothetical protein
MFFFPPTLPGPIIVTISHIQISFNHTVIKIPVSYITSYKYKFHHTIIQLQVSYILSHKTSIQSYHTLIYILSYKYKFHINVHTIIIHTYMQKNHSYIITLTIMCLSSSISQKESSTVCLVQRCLH